MSSTAQDPFAPPPSPEHIIRLIKDTDYASNEGRLHLAQTLLWISIEHPIVLLSSSVNDANGGSSDPLNLLDAHTHTIGLLYFLAARLTSDNSPPLELVNGFCTRFDPEQARLVPQQVTAFAQALSSSSIAGQYPKAIIQPLRDLFLRYAPDGTTLTTIHMPLFTACIASAHLYPILPLLSQLPTFERTVSPDTTPTQALTTYYLGGIALTMLKRWTEAADWLEVCATFPAMGNAVSAVQVEALKRLVLVHLIAFGKPQPTPKYISVGLLRMVKNSSYTTFASYYPLQRDSLRAHVEKDNDLYERECTLGLVQQALDRAPRWAIQKLTKTYLSLSLADIQQEVGLESEASVRSLLLNMIEADEISATLSADGIVTFAETGGSSAQTGKYSKFEVDRLLVDAQEQAVLLEQLELEINRSREYLSKAAKIKEEDRFSMPEEDLLRGGAGPGGWDEGAY